MKMKNILVKLIAVIIMAVIFQITVLATESKASVWSEIMLQAREFIRAGEEGLGDTTIDTDEVEDASSNMFNFLLGIATAATVIIGGILGIKFLLASAEEKAEIKQAMVPYIIGCVVVFGAFAIWRLVVNLLQSAVL